MTAGTIATAVVALVFTLAFAFAVTVFAGPAWGFVTFAVVGVLASVAVGDTYSKAKREGN